MPRYRFTGFHETVLHGLSHGVNAELHRDDDHEQPEGSTVVALPGDEVSTDEPYLHAQMVNVESGLTDLPAAEPPDDGDEKPAKRARRTPRKPATPPVDDDAESQV